jgi:hypothetical protein
MKSFFFGIIILAFGFRSLAQIDNNLDSLLTFTKVRYAEALNIEIHSYKKKKKYNVLKYIPKITYTPPIFQSYDSPVQGLGIGISANEIYRILRDKEKDAYQLEKFKSLSEKNFKRDSVNVCVLYSNINHLIHAYRFHYAGYEKYLQLMKIYELQYDNNEINIEQYLKHEMALNNHQLALLEKEHQINQECSKLSEITNQIITYKKD